MTRTRLVCGVALGLATLTAVAVVSRFERGAHAEGLIFAVNSTADEPDYAIGDLSCQSVSKNCTLRAAIQEANFLPGPDSITVPAGTYTLAIPGAGEDAGATGDLDITGDLTITGAGADSTVIDAGALDRVFDIHGSATVTLSRMTLRNGQAGASDGGAVRNTGTLTLRNVLIQNNHAHDGGGISNHGTVTITETAIVGNASDGGNGGAIANFSTATLATLINATLSGNTAVDGAGASNESAMTFTNVTIADNTASGGGGGFFENEGAVEFRNAIVARNHNDNCAGPGGYITHGHNLSDTSDCLFQNGLDLQNTDPHLGSLGDNGGPNYTLTHALLPGSPAIDAGDTIGCPPIDQRGVARPQDGDGNGSSRCDIGAFELSPPTTATPTTSPSATPTMPPTETPTAPAAQTATPTPTRAPPTVTPTPASTVGDVNCDHQVNSIDAALLLQYGAGLLHALACQSAGDVNHDGQTNSIDAALVLQYTAGLLSHLPP